MNKQTFVPMWDHLRLCHGITLRAIATLPEDRIDSRPIPNMRSVKELVVHLYSDVVWGMTESVARGEFDHDLTREREKSAAAKIATRGDLLSFARDSWAAADRTFGSITDAQVQAPVKTPFGVDPPGGTMLHMQKDEYLHHRGQLYAYLRALGAEPPMIWDFDHNEPDYRPKTAAAKS